MSLNPSAKFAQVERTESDTLLTSANVVEHRHAVATDEISPDMLVGLIPDQIRVIEHLLWDRMVAVDWGSLRAHVEKSPIAGTSILVIRLDVL